MDSYFKSKIETTQSTGSFFVGIHHLVNVANARIKTFRKLFGPIFDLFEGFDMENASLTRRKLNVRAFEGSFVKLNPGQG